MSLSMDQGESQTDPDPGRKGRAVPIPGQEELWGCGCAASTMARELELSAALWCGHRGWTLPVVPGAREMA